MMMNKSPQPAAPALLRVSPLQIGGLLIGVMLVSGGAGWWLSRVGNRSAAAPVTATAVTSLSVETAIARHQTVATNRTLTGTVEPMETVTLTSRVMGQIRQLPVQEGDRVSAGATLAIIDVADLQAQGSQALAGVNMAQSNYQTAQARLQESRAQLLEAEATLADAQLQQRRMSMLQSEGAVSQQLLDQANTRVQMSQARVQQIHAGIAQAQATMQQAQAQVKQAQAQVTQVSANLNYGTITAPFAGVITRKHTEVGAMAGAGQPLLTLESSDRLRFSTQVPESLITQIRKGQTVSIHLDALNQDLPGTVSQIIPSADPATRNFTVKVILNRTTTVIPGMFGRLKLGEQTATQNPGDRTMLMIPKSAIIQQFGITGVYKIINGRASFQPITTGKPNGADTEVFSGLTEGDRVILAPSSNLKDGTPVQIN
jgi:multidrug efflux pump subunit AcrA (membrane-fusion protein)